MHAPTNHRSLGRLDPAAAALSAVTICDAMRIGSSVVSPKIRRRSVNRAAVNA
jgi:hypothetical protein